LAANSSKAISGRILQFHFSFMRIPGLLPLLLDFFFGFFARLFVAVNQAAPL